MTDTPVIIQRDGAIARVTLNEPRSRNALSGPVLEALLAFVETANLDDSLSCIVLTGAGESFCSGGNVKEMRDGTHPMFTGAPHAMQEAYRRHIQRMPRAFHALDVPVIAAVNGTALGAGFDLACMCDIRLAAPEAVFAESFLRVGLISGDGGAWFLPRVVGPARAMELALTCRTLSATEAEAWGIISRIVPREMLIDEAMTLARQIAAFPPKSVRLNKRLVRRSAESDLNTALELAAGFQAIVQSSADQKEAVAALLERRAPHFEGC